MSGDVVGVNRNDGDALGLILGAEHCELTRHMFDEGTVIADEHHEQRAAFELTERDGSAVDIDQREIGRVGAERKHGAGGFYHDGFRVNRDGGKAISC